MLNNETLFYHILNVQLCSDIYSMFFCGTNLKIEHIPTLSVKLQSIVLDESPGKTHTAMPLEKRELLNCYILVAEFFSLDFHAKEF